MKPGARPADRVAARTRPKWLSERGVAAVVLRYRLARETGSPYKIDVHALQDGQRALRLVRSRAKAWNIDPNRVGMMGFSAGGEVVAMVCRKAAKGDEKAELLASASVQGNVHAPKVIIAEGAQLQGSVAMSARAASSSASGGAGGGNEAEKEN